MGAGEVIDGQAADFDASRACINVQLPDGSVAAGNAIHFVDLFPLEQFLGMAWCAEGRCAGEEHDAEVAVTVQLAPGYSLRREDRRFSGGHANTDKCGDNHWRKNESVDNET